MLLLQKEEGGINIMPFISYPHIENHYRDEHIEFYLNLFPELKDMYYGIYEKIHGCNIQLIFDIEEKMRVATKKKVLDYEEPFNDVWETLYGIVGSLTKIQEYADYYSTNINVYGELFGPSIGKGVKYFDYKAYRIFEIRFDGAMQSPEVTETFLGHLGIDHLYVPCIDVVQGLDKALAFDCRLASRINKLVDDNIMEGIVIKPYAKTIWLQGKGTFMLKKKNEEFLAKMREPKRRKEPTVMDIKIDELNKIFQLYVTENRLMDIYSHYGRIEDRKDIGKYIKYVLNDAKESFFRDHAESELDHMSKADIRAVFNVGATIANMIKKEFNWG